MIRQISYYTLISILALFIYSCATPEPVSEEDVGREIEREPFAILDFSDELIASYLEDFELDELDEAELLFYNTRSRLIDKFATDRHDMPDFFLQEIEEVEVDIYQGFRIQIESTRDVDLADSTLAEFEAWADTTFSGYSPRGYVHYRQPYYRVRVGDFHDRDRATELSQLLKVRYPSAWVIHDRINPYRVPADTTEFSLSGNINRSN